MHIDPADIPSPVQAAGASAVSFTSGALLPLLAILLPPAAARVPVTFVAVLIALGLTGAHSARLGGSDVRRAVLRVVIGGALGLAFTYGIGHLFGTVIGLPGTAASHRNCQQARDPGPGKDVFPVGLLEWISVSSA